MSKHKHFHGIKNSMQMLQHGRREGLGPFYNRYTRREKGALAPGERCDCQIESEPSTKLEKTEKAAPVLEHRSGRVETGLQAHISTSSLTK